MKSKMTQHKGPEINAYTNQGVCNQGFEEDSGKTWVLPSYADKASFVSGNKCKLESSLSFTAPPFTHIKPSRGWIISNLHWQVHRKFIFKNCFNQNCSIQKALGAQIELWSKKLIDQWTESAQKIIFPVASVYGIWNILVRLIFCGPKTWF